jgi:hypothetical protein
LSRSVFVLWIHSFSLLIVSPARLSLLYSTRFNRSTLGAVALQATPCLLSGSSRAGWPQLILPLWCSIGRSLMLGSAPDLTPHVAGARLCSVSTCSTVFPVPCLPGRCLQPRRAQGRFLAIIALLFEQAARIFRSLVDFMSGCR